MLYVLLPISALIAAAAIGAFVWSVRAGQLDDMETPPRRILFDDAGPRRAAAPPPDQQA